MDHPLCEVSLSVTQGQRVAVIGPNGHGKSTLMKTLMHQVPALSGTFLLGHQIDVGYFDQELAQFNSAKTVLEEVWNNFPDLNRTEIRTALGSFFSSPRKRCSKPWTVSAREEGLRASAW